mmetsp:Transcript_11696/g.30767  ORF Transcript_11696/g.30767 Transcript_11696/m.30767 type:complete len:170 (-) Transcript_11696:29-538(-)
MDEPPAPPPSGPWLSLWAYMLKLLDSLGAEWHRQEFSSRTYRSLLHIVYASSASYGILAFLFVSALLWDKCGDCVNTLYPWVVCSSIPLIYDYAYHAADVLIGCASTSLRLCKPMQRHAFNGTMQLPPGMVAKVFRLLLQAYHGARAPREAGGASPGAASADEQCADHR